MSDLIIRGKARPQILLDGINVWEAAMNRLRYIFEEFEGSVVVSNSGGKDSTVLLEMAAQVAREGGYGPLKVQWLDQECEFQSTVDYQRYLAYERDDIDFQWYQVPFKIYNATNHENPWLNCWGEGEEWVREKEPGSYQVNDFGTDRFAKLLDKINERNFQAMPNGKMALLIGMRSEESPNRRLALTTRPSYKWLTYSYGGAKGKSYYSFNPLFDWSYRDIWKSIYDNDWRYNSHYDELHRYGVPAHKMRVSNYTHEGALSSLKYLQEIEPETWEKAERRLNGINSFKHVGQVYVSQLPYMFQSWEEYFHYLNDNLIEDPEVHKLFLDQAKKASQALPRMPEGDLYKFLSEVVVTNDAYGSIVDKFIIGNNMEYGKVKEGRKA